MQNCEYTNQPPVKRWAKSCLYATALHVKIVKRASKLGFCLVAVCTLRSPVCAGVSVLELSRDTALGGDTGHIARD